ncbi:MAG: hypothetical protein ABFS22_12215 [Pseudomonadota bacterium]
MYSIRSAVLATTLLLLASQPATADVLLIESINSAPVILTPHTGTSMASVRAGYGAPVTEYPTVSTGGNPHQPPITRWDYDGFSVFFEHDKVVHSVVRRPESD